MCGRYYVDDETAREIEKLVQPRWLPFWQEGAVPFIADGRDGDFPVFRENR